MLLSKTTKALTAERAVARVRLEQKAPYKFDRLLFHQKRLRNG